MDKTTLYNHKELGTVDLPLIPNLIYKETIESLLRGEKDFYELIIEEYTLESNQKSIAENLYNKL